MIAAGSPEIEALGAALPGLSTGALAPTDDALLGDGVEAAFFLDDEQPATSSTTATTPTAAERATARVFMSGTPKLKESDLTRYQGAGHRTRIRATLRTRIRAALRARIRAARLR